MNREGCSTVNYSKGTWTLLLTLMMFVFSLHGSVQTGSARVRSGSKPLGAIRSQISKDIWHEDPTIRSRAILALGRIYYLDRMRGFSPIVDALRRDKDKEVRLAALIILGVIPGGKHGVTRSAVRAVQEVVATERDPDLRRFASVALLQWVKLDKHTDKIWKYYLEMLQHPVPQFQNYALEALYKPTLLSDKERMAYHKLHPTVITQLEVMARSPQPSDELVKAVSHIWTGNTTKPLIEWLHDEDYELRKTSALALERQSRQNSDAVVELLDTLRSDSSVKARTAAAKSLTELSTGLTTGLYSGHPRYSARLERRKFPPKMQQKIWNALVEAAQHDAPEVRASALLSLANLKEGEPSAWRIFTDAIVDKETSVRQKDERVKTAAIRGLGQAIYISFNESIEAVLLHTIENRDESYLVRFHAVESLLLFDYWDDLLHDVMVDLLSDEKLRLSVTELWGEYSRENARASRKLRVAFRQNSNPQIRLYLAMALLKSGQVDRDAIEILVYQGLKDSECTWLCVDLLGRSGYSEPFVIEGLLETLRDSLDAIGPVKGSFIESLTRNKKIDILSYGGDMKGSGVVMACVEALLALDKYNNELQTLLPKVMYYQSGTVQSIYSTYAHRFQFRAKVDDATIRSLIRQERRKNR